MCHIYGIADMVISATKDLEPCNIRRWFEDYHNSLHQLQNALLVLLASSTENLFQRRVNGVHHKGYNLSMQTYVAQSHQPQTARKGTSYASLMIIVGSPGFIS
jgi:hypothetical protein